MRTLASPRRFTAFVLTLSVLLQPAAAFAGEWGLPNAGDVSRGHFIRAAVRAFALKAKDADSALRYQRVPRAMQPFVRAADEQGALKMFTNDLRLSAPITRGEAIQITVVLAGFGQSGTGKSEFRDVRVDTPLARAVEVAIDQDWMSPVRVNQFGVNQPLTAAEAENLLKKASGKAGQRGKDDRSQDTGLQVITVKLPTQRSVVVPKTDLMQTVWEIINNEYLYEEKINQEEAAFRAIEGLVESLDDPYTTFLRPVKAQNFRNQIKGEVTGIGAQVEDRSGVLTIVTPLRGSPAEKAGLLPGDEVLAVDGVSLKGVGFLEAVDKVRGPKGSMVKLRIRRSGNEFDVNVMRDVVTIPEIEITTQDNVGIVRIMQFGGTTDAKLRGELQKLQDMRVKGVILDLRNNPGGLAHAAITVVSNFVPRGTLVYTAKSRSSSEDFRTEDMPTIDLAIPLVVLINAGSASASEIVAGALQDTGRATLVGEKSFGKGTVQAVLQFQDQSGLKLTIAEWYTPKGRKIDKVGIEPDVAVPYSTERDEQMLKALELLRR